MHVRAWLASGPDLGQASCADCGAPGDSVCLLKLRQGGDAEADRLRHVSPDSLPPVGVEAELHQHHRVLKKRKQSELKEPVSFFVVVFLR